VFDKFCSRKVKFQRRGHQVEQIIRRQLLPRWRERQLDGISHREVREAIEQVLERGKTAYAHNLLDAARALFAYALEHDLIEHNPCDRLKRRQVIGGRAIRERMLTDDELRALWRAAQRLGYPYGPLYLLLILTGARLNEVAGSHWDEFDLAAKMWTVPAARFKAGQLHQVPLTDAMLEVLASLPRFRHGDCVFTTNFGVKPVSGWRVKHRLDRHMLHILRALARRRGEDYSAMTLAPFVNHDIRRTVRTRLSALRIADHIAEQVIGHGRKGIARVYDQHKFASEKLEALTAWQNPLLHHIVQPTPSNVVELRAGEV
jgi:integrase